jgi:hypothetical protein
MLESLDLAWFLRDDVDGRARLFKGFAGFQ